MNSTSQLDPHPDAESLSAFAEHALPDSESAAILSHMAVCGRCREILFLAEEASLAVNAQATAPDGHAPKSSRSRLSWRFAWIPVAALAVLAGVALFLGRVEEPGPKLDAKVATSTRGSGLGSGKGASIGGVASSGPTAARPSIARPFTSRKEAKAVERPAPASALPGAKLATDAAVASGNPELALPRGRAARNQTAAASPAAGMASQTVPVQQTAPMVSASDAAVIGLQASPIEGSHIVHFGWHKAASEPKAAKAPAAIADQARVQAAGQLAATPASATPAAAPQLPSVNWQAAPAPARVLNRYALGLGGIRPGTDSDLEQSALHDTLPSGLAPISTAALRRRLLAVDSAGNVYFSKGLGQKWQAVARVWSGNALQVKAQPPSATAFPPKAPPVSGAQLPPLRVFELVTDRGATWVSEDGIGWTEKPKSP